MLRGTGDLIWTGCGVNSVYRLAYYSISTNTWTIAWIPTVDATKQILVVHATDEGCLFIWGYDNALYYYPYGAAAPFHVVTDTIIFQFRGYQNVTIGETPDVIYFWRNTQPRYTNIYRYKLGDAAPLL